MQIIIKDDCVCCGACETINPDIFTVDKKAKVNQKTIDINKQDCIDAALVCPANAIWIDDIFDFN
ncbi:MAG: ferredoxin [Candidatus Gastranaerophilales bacterium]|nr:ferredoxin [Candidatus Gastranaerophilales bacterium]